MKSQTIELGDEVKDKITGYRGIVKAIAKCLTGCDRIDVGSTKLNKDGTLPGGYWFDVTQLEIIKKQKVKPSAVQEPENKPNRKVGGPPTRSFL